MRPPIRAHLCRGVLLLAFTLLGAGAAAVAIAYPNLLILLGCYVMWRRAHRSEASGAYGTARLADGDTVASMTGGPGPAVVLGRFGLVEPPTRRRAVKAVFDHRMPSDLACEMFFTGFYRTRAMSDRLIRLSDFVHLNTVAPAGAGKSTRVIIPNLRLFNGTCVVVDPKGELYKATAADRSRMGQKVFRLDPYQVAGPGSDHLNPLDFLKAGTIDLVEQCRDTADQMIDRKSTAKDPHWDESSYNVAAGILYLICACKELQKEERNLQSFRDVVASEQNFAKALAVMKAGGHDKMMNRLGGIASWFKDKELSSVVTTLHRHTQWLDSHRMEEILASSTFDLMDLRSASGATLYLILPPDKLSVMAGLMRLWLGTILRQLTKPGNFEGKPPVLFLVDEAAQIGRMRALEESVTFLRGMGIRMWFFWQSLDQMKTCFEHPNVVLGNLATQQFLGINDYDTAEAISRRIGDETCLVQTSSTTTGTSTTKSSLGHPQTTTSRSSTTNFIEIARRLLKPEEIIRLRSDVGLLFHRNQPVIPTRLVPYFADRMFRGSVPKPRRVNVAAGFLAALTLTISLYFAAVGFNFLLLSPTGTALFQGIRRATAPYPGPAVPTGQSQSTGLRPPYRNASSRTYSSRRTYIPRNMIRIP